MGLAHPMPPFRRPWLPSTRCPFPEASAVPNSAVSKLYMSSSVAWSRGGARASRAADVELRASPVLGSRRLGDCRGRGAGSLRLWIASYHQGGRSGVVRPPECPSFGILYSACSEA